MNDWEEWRKQNERKKRTINPAWILLIPITIGILLGPLNVLRVFEPDDTSVPPVATSVPKLKVKCDDLSFTDFDVREYVENSSALECY